jgi:superfamily II DNA or RNA helicase
MSLSDSERRQAVDVLVRRLSLGGLQQLLAGGDRRAIDRIVTETEATSSNDAGEPSADDVAQFLIDSFSTELLMSRDVRMLLATSLTDSQLMQLCDLADVATYDGRSTQVTAVASRNWHPGKRWAREFAQVVGLPPAFAGAATVPAAPDFEEIEPYRPLPDLQDFQDDLRLQLIDVLRGDSTENRGILSLPTGAGKTRTAVEACLEWWVGDRQGSGNLLWIAQSDELCEQAVQAFREVWLDRGHRERGRQLPTLTVHRLWGAGRAIPGGHGVIVASIQKLHTIFRSEDESNPKREALQELGGNIVAIVIDEAHSALAKSYSDVLGFLGAPFTARGHSPIPVAGLTATPFRSQDEETRLLVARFHKRLLTPACLPDEPLEFLRERGVLARPTHRVLASGARSVKLTEAHRKYLEDWKDFPPDYLAKLGQEARRNRTILDALLGVDRSWPLLFFGCSVEHATAMVVLLRRAGRTAAAVTASTRPGTRRALIEDFRSGRISALCNHGVLTTGFDAPSVRAVCIARPTTSVVLYEQMIGRGMRGPVFGGTPECLVIDIEDNVQFGGQMAYTRFQEYWAASDERS